jgi:hypothetical protein
MRLCVEKLRAYVRAKNEIVDFGRGGADGGSNWRGAEQQRALGDERAVLQLRGARALEVEDSKQHRTVRTLGSEFSSWCARTHALVAAAARRGAAHDDHARRYRAASVARRGRAQEH